MKERKAGLNQEGGSGQGRSGSFVGIWKAMKQFSIFAQPSVPRNWSQQRAQFCLGLLTSHLTPGMLYPQTSPDNTLPQVPDTLVTLTFVNS